MLFILSRGGAGGAWPGGCLVREGGCASSEGVEEGVWSLVRGVSNFFEKMGNPSLSQKWETSLQNGNTVNAWSVRILLEYILVLSNIYLDISLIITSYYY